MAETAENPAPASVKPVNPLTGKPRTRSNGTDLGDATEAFQALPTPEERYEFLKTHKELQKYFRLSQFDYLEK